MHRSRELAAVAAAVGLPALASVCYGGKMNWGLRLSGQFGSNVFDRVSRGRFAPEIWGDRHLDPNTGGWNKLDQHFGPSFRAAVAGKCVVEVGSAAGLEVLAVADVAHEVTGLEIRVSDLDTSRTLARNRQNVSFESYPPPDYAGKIDVVYSIDSMEHFSDPLGMLQRMRGLLRPSGRIFLSFGPTWYHPYGAHMNHISKLPWVHLLFNESVVLEKYRQKTGHEATRYEETGDGLNRMTIARFRSLVKDAGLCGAITPVPIKRTHRLARFVPEFLTSHVMAVLSIPSPP
jgi:2-polyprenyl-3-methyl-5-hydroxy-6-metoxy-1,4-benzoquinol methylase